MSSCVFNMSYDYLDSSVQASLKHTVVTKTECFVPSYCVTVSAYLILIEIHGKCRVWCHQSSLLTGVCPHTHLNLM